MHGCHVERVDRARLKPALRHSVVAVNLERGGVDSWSYGVVWERLRYARENQTGSRTVTHAHLVRVLNRGVVVPGRRPALVPVPEVYVVHGAGRRALAPPSLCELSRNALVLWDDAADRFLRTRVDMSSAESRWLRFQMR